MRKMKRMISVLYLLGLCGSMVVSAYEPKETNRVIRYSDGCYAEVTGTEESIQNKTDTKIGSKTYIYHDLDGTVLFTYTVKVSFCVDGQKAEPIACYTSFYVSDGWKKQKDNFDRGSGTAVFSDGKKEKRSGCQLHAVKQEKFHKYQNLHSIEIGRRFL